MKRIKYEFLPIGSEVCVEKKINSSDENFELNLSIARSEAVGEVIVEDIPDFPEEQIAKLKAQLESTDYKIIKCSEAQMVGEALPYDIVALHGERQALRDRINELESGGDST